MTDVTNDRPIRILHVVGGMNYGGVETWLMHALRRMNRQRFHFDFMVHTDKPCAYDEEIRLLGSNIIPCLYPSQPCRYAKNFFRIMKEHGPYDVIHSHVHHFSGFVLWLAKKAGVPVRISHSHNDTLNIDSNGTFLRKAYLKLMEQFIHKCATTGVACSEKAALALFGPQWQKNGRLQILYCGVDLQPFSKTVVPNDVRRELGIPIDAYVVGHVGRFSEQKNHAFLVDIMKCVVEMDTNVRCLLIGDGPLRGTIQAKIRDLGLADYFVLAGLRSDVPRLMLGAMDVFLLPSLNEGLPLVLIEAQAAGLQVIVSDCVTREIDIVPKFFTWLSLSDPPSKWADAVCRVLKTECDPIHNVAYGIIERSPFNIHASVHNLEQVYKADE